MMNFIKEFSFLLLATICLFTACQTESAVEIYSTKETITKTTPLTTYVERLVMQKTFQDNIIDNSNCFMIKFPYTITVNFAQISINSEDDFQLVKANINAHPNDKDIVTIQFPVTVIFKDYSEKIIVNQTAFNTLITECQANSNDFGKINCVTINFPITVNIYNSANQIASSVEIASNKSFYDFIKNLNDHQFIALNYPISIIDFNKQNITITNNSQFENVIKYAIDNCMDNNNTPLLGFMDVITEGSWKISYFFDDYEKTSLYNGYVFVFKNDRSVTATKSGVSVIGQWDTKVDNGVREFKVSFNSDLLHQLDKDWKLFEFNNSRLRFRKEEGGRDNDYLYFEKN